MLERGKIDNMSDSVNRLAASVRLFGGLRLLVLCVSGLLFLLTGSGDPSLAQITAPQGSHDLIAAVTNGYSGPAALHDTNMTERVSTARNARLPNLVWFSPSSWYPYVEVNGQRVPGRAPGGAWRPGFGLQGDFTAMFEPGAQWDPSDVGVLFFNGATVRSSINPNLQAMVNWANNHPKVKIGILVTPVTVGPGGCVSSGTQGFPPKGTPLTASDEGVFYSVNYPGVDYPYSEWIGIEDWKRYGGRLDVLLFDTPLTAGIDRCDFTVAQTVAHMLPMIRKVQKFYPNVQFASEQGVVWWTNHDWIYKYSLPFFQEFARQVGVPMGYTNLDMFLKGDIRKPPTPPYETIAAATSAFTAAGVKVGVNIVASPPRAGETQAQWIAENKALMQQTLDSGVPLDHLEYAPFTGFSKYDWVLDNLPESSPSALTSLLPLSH